jgi:hypothetical protein
MVSKDDVLVDKLRKLRALPRLTVDYILVTGESRLLLLTSNGYHGEPLNLHV